MVHRLGLRRHAGKHLAVVAIGATDADARVGHHSRTRPKSAMASRTYLYRWQVSKRGGSQVRHREGRRGGMAA